MKYLVWGLILFGGYSGWKFMPVFMAKSSISRAIQKAGAEIEDGMPEHIAIRRLVRRAHVMSIELDPERISIEWERPEGQRIVYVDVEHEMTIDYLGSRTVSANVSSTEVYPVDEGAIARKAAANERRADQYQELRDVNQAIQSKKRDAIARCERETGGPCEIINSGGSYMGRGHTSVDDVEIVERY